MRLRYRTLLYVIMTVIVLLIATICVYALSINGIINNLTGFNYFDVLLGQIGNTLIVLSLTSVLSENFGQAYWVDIKDTKLISPFWGCFIGITVYLLTAAAFSVIAYATGYLSGVVVSATFALLLLIVLTFKMISIYFGKEALKSQLRVRYKKMVLLDKYAYIDDYLLNIRKLRSELEHESFSGKNGYIRNLDKEIRYIEKESQSSESGVCDLHRNHINNHTRNIDKLKDIDMKIEEYTKKAIANNKTEVVIENIELLVESENYDTFFKLIEELFEWDEKYTCKVLYNLSKKNTAWMIKGKMRFFKGYALDRLISESGKLDAIQNLLMIYDQENLGMEGIEHKKREIVEKLHVSNSDEKMLREELLSALGRASAKDMRLYYVPIKEACEAYNERKYGIVNKYIRVILENYDKDVQMIKINSGITEFKEHIVFKFSYVTDEENKLIDELINRDKENKFIDTDAKEKLLSMSNVVLDNNPWNGVNEESIEVFMSAIDKSLEDLSRKK